MIRLFLPRYNLQQCRFTSTIRALQFRHVHWFQQKMNIHEGSDDPHRTFNFRRLRLACVHITDSLDNSPVVSSQRKKCLDEINIDPFRIYINSKHLMENNMWLFLLSLITVDAMPTTEYGQLTSTLDNASFSSDQLRILQLSSV